ncbi:MAG TPA: hypothetical protein ENI98_07035 [Gammaproteobacteria bacterium]|nr:hypothetical protein [Gammaproteobacteria bacterium]
MKNVFNRQYPTSMLSVMFLMGTLAACSGGASNPTSNPPGRLPQLSVDSPMVTEGDMGAINLVFTATLSTPASSDVTVDFATTNATATAGDDYIARNGTLQIIAGSNQGTITIAINGDTDVENDETFSLDLSNISSNATLGTNRVTGTIRNDDYPIVSIEPVSLDEGDSGTTNMDFIVSMNVPAIGDVTLDYASSDLLAESGEDYTLTSGSLTIPEGQTTAIISVPVSGDILPEPDETLTMSLANLSDNARFDMNGDKAIGTIANDDSALMSIGSVSGFEGAAGETQQLRFTVMLDAPTSGDVSFDYATSDGSAIAPGDYSATSGTATIPAGDTSIYIPVSIHGDDDPQGNKIFMMTLSNVVGNATLNPNADVGAGTIIEDDVTAARPEVRVTAASVTEGDEPNTAAMVFKVVVSPTDSAPISFDYATADVPGQAVAGTDYIAASGQATIPADVSQTTITVTVQGDSEIESDERFNLLLSNLSGNATLVTPSVTGRINDDDDPQQTLPRINVTDAGQLEGDDGVSSLIFEISLSKPATTDVSVDFATQDISAVAGSDYREFSGSTLIPQGQTSVTLPVSVIGDTLIEVDEQFQLVLSNVDGEAVLGDYTAVGTILSDDSLAVITVENAGVAEGVAGETNHLVFNVSLNTAVEDPVTFEYVTSDDTAISGTGTAEDDYIESGGTVTIPAGATTASITIDVIGDDVVEPDETMTLQLGNASLNATLGNTVAIGSIGNDDNTLGWQAPVLLETEPADQSFDPQVAFAGNGEAMVVWINSYFDGASISQTIKSRRFTGGVWDPNMEDATGNLPSFQVPELSLALAGNGNALVATDLPQITVNEYLPGTGWSTPLEITNTPFNRGVKLAGNSAGHAIAVWYQLADVPNYNTRIWHSLYSPGQGWSTPALVNTDPSVSASYPVSVAMDAAGNALVAWPQPDLSQQISSATDIFVRRYNASSGLWDDQENIDHNETSANSTGPVIAMNDYGNAMVVWLRDGQQEMAANYYSYDEQTKTGSWRNAPMQVEQNTGYVYTPDVALDVAGNAFVVWSQQSTSTDIYANRYDVAGDSWRTTNGEVLEQATGQAIQPKVATDAAGNAIVTWIQDIDAADDNSFLFVYDLRANRFSGNSWEGPQTIENHTEGVSATSEHNIAIDADGNAIVVWSKYDNDTDTYPPRSVWGVRYLAQ